MKVSHIVTYNPSSTTNLTKLSGSTTKVSDGGSSSTTSPFILFCKYHSETL